MPICRRRELRQRLGLEYLRDTVVGTTDAVCSAGVWLTLSDGGQADATASGEPLYQRAWARVLGSLGVLQDGRVASFDAAGVFVLGVTTATTVLAGMPYEIGTRLAAAEKDRALDAVIRDVRTRQEVTLWTRDGMTAYSLGAEVVDVLDVGVDADPSGTLGRRVTPVGWFGQRRTAAGMEVRIAPGVAGSCYLVLDALVRASLGASDLATVNVPSDDLVLAGAAARCLWLLEQDAPGQEAAVYRERRAEMAREYTRLARRFQPAVTRRVMPDEPW